MEFKLYEEVIVIMNKKIKKISPYVQELVKLTGKKVSEIEKLWDKAKKIAKDMYGIEEKDFKETHYRFMVDTVKNMLGFNENKSLVVEFINSEKSAKEFIQEAITTTSDFPQLWKSHIKSEEDEDDEINVGEEIDKIVKQTEIEDNYNDGSNKKIVYDIEQLKKFPIEEVYKIEEGITMEIKLPNGKRKYIKAESIEKAKEEGWCIGD